MLVFDYLVITGAVCAVFMVVGSMILLYKGAISLQAVPSDDEALSIELVKQIKLSTRYPALGLFLIGLVFLIVALNYGNKQRSFSVSGRFSSPDQVENVQIITSAGPWEQEIVTNKFEKSFHPTVDKIRIQIIAPGYEKPKHMREISIKADENVNLGDIELGKKIVFDKDFMGITRIAPRRETRAVE